jgi:hypothetical protein
VLAGFLAWWPPLLAWLTATSVVLVTCAKDGYPPFAPVTTWERHDAIQYLRVAHLGYNLARCAQLHPPVAGATWCGDSGWFPLYPWILSGLHHLGLQTGPAALIISWLASLGTLIVLWRAFLAGRPGLSAALALCYAAFAPGLIYNYGEFPLSLAAFCTVCALALLQRGRWVPAGIAAAAAALAYPVGLAVAPACALWLLTDRTASLSRRAGRATGVLLPTLAGLAVFAVVLQVSTGRWNAYLLVQDRYRHRAQDPFAELGSVLRGFAHSPFVARPSYTTLAMLTGAPALQTLLVAFVILCVVAELAVRRGPNARDDALVAIWAVLAWAVLSVATGVDTYRGDVALLPVAALVRRLPWPLAAFSTAGAVVLVVPMTHLYLARALI